MRVSNGEKLEVVYMTAMNYEETKPLVRRMVARIIQQGLSHVTFEIKAAEMDALRVEAEKLRTHMATGEAMDTIKMMQAENVRLKSRLESAVKAHEELFGRLKDCQAQFMAKNDHLNSVMTENSLLFGRAVAINKIVAAVKRALDSAYFYFQLRPPDSPGGQQTFEQLGEARKLFKEMDRLK